jgi:hypothetical protein
MMIKSMTDTHALVASSGARGGLHETGRQEVAALLLLLPRTRLWLGFREPLVLRLTRAHRRP